MSVFQEALEKVTCSKCGKEVPITAARAKGTAIGDEADGYETVVTGYVCLECEPIEEDAEPEGGRGGGE